MRILDFSDGFSSASPPSTSGYAFTFANNQAAAANVTSALLDSTKYISALVSLFVVRQTSTGYRFSRVDLFAVYDSFNAAWTMVDINERGSSNLADAATAVGPSGLTLTVTGAGQIQYTSDNMAGASYNGASKFTISEI